jgi:hypothetical protein
MSRDVSSSRGGRPILGQNAGPGSAIGVRKAHGDAHREDSSGLNPHRLRHDRPHRLIARRLTLNARGGGSTCRRYNVAPSMSLRSIEAASAPHSAMSYADRYRSRRSRLLPPPYGPTGWRDSRWWRRSAGRVRTVAQNREEGASRHPTRVLGGGRAVQHDEHSVDSPASRWHSTSCRSRPMHAAVMRPDGTAAANRSGTSSAGRAACAIMPPISVPVPLYRDRISSPSATVARRTQIDCAMRRRCWSRGRNQEGNPQGHEASDLGGMPVRHHAPSYDDPSRLLKRGLSAWWFA